MKIWSLLLTLAFSCGAVYSQKKDTIDHIILKIPADWQLNKQNGFVELKNFDKDKKNFCQLAVYSAVPATADKKNDFKKEWKELIEQNFTVFTLAEPISVKSASGITMQRMGAKAVGKDGKNYYVQLNVFDCGVMNQSVIAVSGNQKQLKVYDSLWQSLIAVTKQRKGAEPSTVTGVAPSNTSLVGKWAKSSSSPPQYQNGALVNLVNSGYHKGEYFFKDDGKYNFHSESMFNSNDYLLVDETGTYVISEGTISLIPIKGSLRKVDGNGSIKKQESIPLTKRNYSWTIHFFEGINEHNLVLSGQAENIMDGAFAMNGSFPNSFLYSKEFKPEWKFKID